LCRSKLLSQYSPPSYNNKGWVSFDCQEGGYNADEFMYAVQGMVIPFLQPFPLPNSVLVLDNCSIHHTYEDDLREMVEGVGAKLVFLAPYSPIDNPIESGFNVLKTFWIQYGINLF